MLLLRCLVVVGALAATGFGATTTGDNVIMDTVRRLENELNVFKTAVKQTIGGLARQMMLQQLYVEEQTRSNGGSGVKMIRNTAGGTKPYHFAAQSQGGVTAIHEHSNYDRTAGMGEFIGVLNGVEFRTRHNDYKLRMPHTTSNRFQATENVPFPDVPPSVLQKKTLDEQVVEMQQYFKAFHDQNTRLRDYRPYFKPVLCYLEGAWTTNTQTLSEPFESDRHHIDADSWFDLQEKVRYTSATGGKSQFENYSYLPTTILNVTDDGVPVYAQWNYRILCHPVKKELHLKDLMLHDDLASRMLLYKNYTQLHKLKAARYHIAPSGGTGLDADVGSGRFSDKRYLHGWLDDIMYEIPGVENYKGSLTDSSFGLLKHQVTKNSPVLNTARYHRHFKVGQSGAMGLQVRNRGFSDPYLFVAQTTNPKIAKMRVEDCHKVNGKNNCSTYETQTTYAIPMELIWLTPLSSWNPHNLHFQNNNNIPKAGGRDGGFTKDKAFNGTSPATYYRTPVEFYHGGEQDRDPADTAKDAVGILDTHGNVVNVTASGIRIFTPEIPGVGKIRIRYPIMPIHEEGNNVYKNLIALQDVTMNMKKYTHMFEEPPAVTGAQGTSTHQLDTHYRTSTSHMNPPGTHYHDLYLTAEEMKALRHTGTEISAYTTEDSGHQHEIVVKMDPAHPDFSRLQMISCDDQLTCWDHHSHYVYLVKE